MLRYKHYEYENGLEVVLKRADYDTACLLLGLRMGPLYESAEMSGASHFIEHMLFQTPAKGSKKKYLENLEWRGISSNAETGMEYLSLEMSCSSRRTDIALESMFNAITAKRYISEDFTAELGNIMLEIDEYYDIPVHYLENWRFLPAMHRGTPLQKQILGTTETLQAFTPEMLFAYRQHFFYPENMVLVVAGNFNEKKVLKKIGETFATLRSTGKNTPLAPPYHPLPYPRLLEDSRPEIQQTYIQVGFRTPGYTHEDYLLLHFLTHILGNSEAFSSRLASTFAVEGGYSYAFGSELEGSPQIGVFSTHLAVAPEQERKVISALKSIYYDLSMHKIKKSELEGVKTRILAESHEVEDGARELFKHVAYGLKYDVLSDAYKKRIKAITADEVLATAQKYLCKKQLTAILRPKE